MFNKGPPPKLPFIEVAGFNTIHKGGYVQSVEPLKQTAYKSLDPNYLSIPYYKEFDYTFIKVMKKIINLTKMLKESEKSKNPHIIIEMNESNEIPNQPSAKLRSATREEIEKIPVIENNNYNIYFQFIKCNIGSRMEEIDEEESSKKRSPKPRRRSCIGTSSSKPKPNPTYNTFSST